MENKQKKNTVHEHHKTIKQNRNTESKRKKEARKVRRRKVNKKNSLMRR